MQTFTLLALALGPGFAIVMFIYGKDRYESEPIGLLFKSFLMGFGSVVLTLIISKVLEWVITINEQDAGEQLINAFFLVALVEEFSKFVFVRGILFRNSNFNEPFDGIVYSVMVGMGFATLENILYVFNGGIETGIYRMFTAVPAHATFAILMGYFLGKAKFEQRKSHYAVFALLVATFFHGAYDYFLFVSFVPGISIGALISLIVAISLSQKAIRIQQQASPFRNPPPENREGQI
jgi:RsiW-degrading membrane proteinase PrsW (M82 family)